MQAVEDCTPVARARTFAYALSLNPRPVVWAAWGTIIEKRPYLWTCLEDMIALGREYGAQWVTCGRRSKAGHPHHPLYLRADAQAEPFDVEEYVRAQQARAAAAVSGRPRRV